MGFFKSKEEKEAIIKERETQRLQAEAIAKEKRLQAEAIAEEKRKKELAIQSEKLRLNNKYEEEIKEVGLTKMMANSEVYNEILIVQNETIIDMLAQIVISSGNMMGAGFAAEERKKYNKNVKDILLKKYKNVISE